MKMYKIGSIIRIIRAMDEEKKSVKKRPINDELLLLVVVLKKCTYAGCMLTYVNTPLHRVASTVAMHHPQDSQRKRGNEKEGVRKRIVCNVSFPSNQYVAIKLSGTTVINRYFLFIYA